MKKIAITLSLTTLLLGGLIGCGAETDQQGTTGQGGQDQRGFGYHTTDQDTRTGITGERAGEGPITDLFTRDDRRGARGFGRDARQPATGLAGERGITNQDGGLTRQDAGIRRTHEGVVRTREPGVGGAGQGAGTGLGMRGDAGIRGIPGQGAGTGFGLRGDAGTGTRTRGQGVGTGLGMRGDAAIGTRDHKGAGIVGNREGYVDNRGILRDRDTTGPAGIGGLGQTGRTIEDNRTGMGTDGTGMRNFAYPTGYDGATVQRITTRLADVENVRDSRVIVQDDRILIGVDTNGKDTQRIEEDVRRTVGGMVGDREVVVVTERDQYNQVRTADDRLRGGEAFEEVGSTINQMFQDFGRAIQRPFERTR